MVVRNGSLKLCSISGHLNPADLGRKRLSAARMKSLMSMLGFFNKGTRDLGGADDPGRVFVRKLNVKALACALSLLQVQLQGCDTVCDASNQFGLAIFTLLIGALMIFGFGFGRWREEPQPTIDHPPQEEPAMVDEPTESASEPGDFIGMSQIGEAISAAYTEQPPDVSAPSSSTSALPSTGIHDAPAVHDESSLPEAGAPWRPEAMLTFMYSRCQRRLLAASSESRRAFEQERMQVLRDVMSACRTGDQATRIAAAHMAHNMSDLSPDADSPNADMSWIGFCNMMDEVQTAVDVGQQIATLAEQAQAGLLEPINTSGSRHVDGKQGLPQPQC